MYAKLIDGVIHYAPREVKMGDTIIYNPSVEMLIADGYLPVVHTNPPDVPQGFYNRHSWAEQDGVITDVWTRAESEDDEEADYAEAGRILMGVEE